MQCYNTCEIPAGEIEVSILDVDGFSLHWHICVMFLYTHTDTHYICTRQTE